MDTNELIYRTETDSQTLKNLWLPRGTAGGGMDWGFGTGMCTLRYMTSQWQPGNSTHYSVIIYVGKESEKEQMCVCV